MTPEIGIGPPGLVFHQGYTVIATECDGQIFSDTEKGFYFFDTRLISSWQLSANNAAWTLLNGGSLGPAAGRIYCINSQICVEGGTIPAKTLALIIGRHVDGGLHEDFDITNYGATPIRFPLTISIESDFADLFDIRAGKPTTRGSVTQSAADDTLTIKYRNKDFLRGVRIKARYSGSHVRINEGKLTFDVEIMPGKTWHACLLYDFVDGEKWFDAPEECVCDFETSGAVKNLQHWLARVVKARSSNAEFDKSFDRAIQDLMALRLPIEGTDQIKFVPAAGLPWFIALFGRDSLIISLQAAIVHPEFAQGTLRVLGERQAIESDDYRDAEPGKILHELRRGELAHFRIIPHTPYYGAADTTPLYITTLHSAWMCSGDRDILLQHLPTAEKCLRWIDKYGDRDGDGFQEYQTRSPDGYENQGWKDSGASVVDSDGALVKGPKALCELQGYVYDAWLRMAQVYDYLGRYESAGELRDKASCLFKKFNAVFWDEELGFYAFALNGDKKPILSIASNPGQCLWSGIVPPERASRVADRLMQPDMLSGWGIRTLSADHPSFNPYKYQLGSVWPHDNGLIAQGMRRYGLTDHALRVAKEILNAGQFFEKHQMPELYAGIHRHIGSFPVQYLGANVPQGWAAGALFSILQVILGFQPEAPDDMLYIDPMLPDWLSELHLRDIRVGRRVFDIDLTRTKNGTTYNVPKGPQDRVRQRAVVTWAKHLTQPNLPIKTNRIEMD